MAKHCNCPAIQTVFYITFKSKLDQNQKISDVEKSKLLREAELAIKDHVQPGMNEIRHYLKEEYLKHTRKEIGISSVPGGLEFYEECIR